MKICRKCGTLYRNKEGECPKCSANKLIADGTAQNAEINTQMSEEEAAKARKKAWIEIIIGIPALIGLIYLIMFAIKALGK